MRLWPGALLLLSSAALADVTVNRSKDGRYFAVEDEALVDASSTAYTFETIDLGNGGKVETFTYTSNNCMTGDSSEDGAQSASECRKEQQAQSKEYEAKVAAWKKKHPVTEAKASRTGASGGVVQASGKGVKPTETGFEVPAGETVWTIPAKGRRPTHQDRAKYESEGAADVYWSEDGQWVLVVFSAEQQRAQVQLIPAMARVDLLDAGAGASANAIAKTLEAAGYPAAHQGKAGSPHARTEIFFAPGFEAEAQQVGTALGATREDVKPVSWGTPYAITVAAAKQ
ncbi:MAG: LytR C-terminal domain-containing protein [Myxococcaceae bacterium]